MVDLHDNWLILMWPLVALFAWVAIATGLAHLLTGGSRERRVDLTPREMSRFGQSVSGEIDVDEHRRHGAQAPPARSPMRAIRCRPGSIRGQITLLTTAVAVLTLLTLLVTGVGMYSTDHARPARWPSGAAARAVNEVHPGTAPGRLRLRGADAGRNRTVSLGRYGVAAPAAVLSAETGGQSMRGSLSPGSLHLILMIEAVELIALAAWATWRATSRVLRPVDMVRAELAVMDVGDLGTRVSEPDDVREVAILCRTINAALQRLQEANEELQDFARSQGQFASDVSHELRNSITGLRMQLEVARQDLAAVRLPDLIATMSGRVERLQAIIDDLLFLARVGACPVTERRQLDLATLVRHEVSRRSHGRPVKLHLAPDSTVNAVPTQISRLLTNLLDNAQRHCAHQVSVDVHVVHAAVELAVSDDGPGIALADRERVFHRHIRLDDARRLDRDGTGLGLAIARDIAYAHDGTLSVEESASGGARFVLRLPRALPRQWGAS
ncbi:sensor histidine kinase [Planotetraspora mira]|uniref:histidine kinase n=1 Tax=Planotetraspora mira TaxID=58121 RepID=A0A8J3X8V4_9ACTN|nr:HAMP domain-containing sensor histidine kinase [Planotetraspora mira]GII32527.1 hypothetical protein Pmi06nite_59690 [Planotetraspora mira]